LTAFFYSYNAYADYASSYDPYLQAGAHLWLLAADQLICLEANWHVLIGAYNSPTNVGCLAYPTIANDGVVTWQSSAYPGGVPVAMPAGVFGNITHMQQTSSPAVASEVSRIMREQMGVLERVPPLSAGIVGGTEGGYGLECTFSASVGGGRSPFSYQWFVNGNLVGTASTYAHTFTGAATLNLFVTDADSSSASAQAALTVDPIGFGSC
jgi:hypothetical protein